MTLRPMMYATSTCDVCLRHYLDCECVVLALEGTREVEKMGLNLHVVGLRNLGGDMHQKWLQLMRALQELGIDELPPKAQAYFGKTLTVAEVLENPALGGEVYLDECLKVEHEGTRDEYWILDLQKLPAGIDKVRFWRMA